MFSSVALLRATIMQQLPQRVSSAYTSVEEGGFVHFRAIWNNSSTITVVET